MATEYPVAAYFLGNTGSDGGKEGKPAIATTITLTDSNDDGLIVEESSDLIKGEEIETLKDSSNLELTNGQEITGWYIELELQSGDKDMFFVPIDGTVPEDGTLAEDVDLNGDQAGHVCDLTPNDEPEPDGIVSGTSGADLIDVDYTGDPDGDRIDNEDAILPGQAPNDDIVFAGRGDDTVFAGLADDNVLGGLGDDELYGEDGDDRLIGQSGDDTLSGGADNDTLFGDFENNFFGPAGHDSLDGGAGDDFLTGGVGDDTLEGGSGNDILVGGRIIDPFFGLSGGADSISGGDDRDYIAGVSAGDTVDGGAGGDDFDTLDLRGSANGGSAEVTFTSEDKEDGFVTYFDEEGVETGTLQFEEIEKIIPICFTPGTMIATPNGERPVEDLRAGDKVITRDNGIQEIGWVGSRGIKGAEMERNTHLEPIHIARGALGDGFPAQDMWLSPNHRVLVANDKTALYFEEPEVLVAAKHLTALRGVSVASPRWTTYIHFMCEQHEIVLSNGSWTESFQPGDYSLNGIGNAQRLEIQELFPELQTPVGRASYQAARRSLKRYEARLLTHR